MNVVLGITGGIAAYKTPELVRKLKERGANVKVILSANAHHFVAPLSLQAVSGAPVLSEPFIPLEDNGMDHIALAKWADVFLIAPASASRIGALAAGLADDLLGTTFLATTAKIFIAPAMNQAMWHHPLVQKNCATLESLGAHIIMPGCGEQACGDTGYGRLADIEEIVKAVIEPPYSPFWSGQHVVITAGPTVERLDPVRYLSNNSSGKMGYAIAEEAARRGAKVTLISGPVALACPRNVERVMVEDARQMHQASLVAAEGASMFIGTAAVADYRPQTVLTQKHKKKEEQWDLTLIKNPDILADVAKMNCFCVGFAAETNDVIMNAVAKLKKKGIALIAVNDVSRDDIGFHSDYNALTLLNEEQVWELPRCSKRDIAKQLLDIVKDEYVRKS